MFWQQDNQAETEYQVPDDVVDLVFRLRGECLDIDHAYALAQALRQALGSELCQRIAVHGVRLAGSGNGWNRPEQGDANLPLSRRARLVIRVGRDDQQAVSSRISDTRLQLGEQPLEIGASSVRKLSSLGTLYARAICCDAEQPEPEFLQETAARLADMGIRVSKMICGRSGRIRNGEHSLFTRALMIADLKPAESVCLQQRGIGDAALLGCGIFVPHKGIDAVYDMQD